MLFNFNDFCPTGFHSNFAISYFKLIHDVSQFQGSFNIVFQFYFIFIYQIFVMIKNAEKQFIYRTYVKVSAMQKLQLISLVFQEEWKIKKAASFLYINYASAKSIILKHRKNSIQKKMPRIPEVRRCHYKKMINGKHNYNILCLKGGIFQNLLENLSQK